MITNHYYLKPTEHVRRSTAVSVSYILSPFLGIDCCTRLKTRYHSGQSGNPYRKEKQQHDHKTVNQKSIVTVMKAKKQKSLFLKETLIIEDRTQTVNPLHTPSLSLFPLVTVPKMNRPDLIFIPPLVTLLPLCSGASYGTALMGLSLQKATLKLCLP